MKRYIILLITLLSFVQLYGCGIGGKSDVKIVVSNDVTSYTEKLPNEDEILKENQIPEGDSMNTDTVEIIDGIKNIKENAIIDPFSKDYTSNSNVEEFQLKLDKGDYFYPLFYVEGEVYGYVGKGAGMYHEGKDESEGYLVKTSDTHPLLGIMKEYLYKIDKNNQLIETDHKALYSLDGNKGAFYLGNNIELGMDKVFYMDISDTKEPQPLIELTNAIKELRGEIDKETYNNGYYKDFFRVGNISGTDRYLMIERFINRAGQYYNRIIYLYDMVEKQFYSNASNVKNGEICYVEHLNSLLWISSNGFIINKIILKEDQYSLQEFVDLSVKKGISRIRMQAINNEQVLLFHDIELDSSTGMYESDRLYKTQLVSKYNFRTNQYEYIYKSPSNETLYYDYVGHDIYLVEKFRQEGEHVVPLIKSLQKLIDKKMDVIYEEKLSGDTFANYPFDHVAVNEDGTELFIAWQLYDLGVWINTIDVKYQKIAIN